MSNKKKSKLTPEQQKYKEFVSQREPKRPIFINCLKAFFVGGTICLIGQGISAFYMAFFDFNEATVGDPTVATLIFLSALFTGLGVYDHLGQWAGAGSAIPVTGFANSVASAAIEHRSEGLVLGVGGNMFKLAGSVIVFGVFAAFIIAIIKILLQGLGGMA
ncbi:stage V sporulation protein AC [Mechercharimyces sp. CAU 1602]|uniref:stage V sporulation protein AC n=1 Tax=Mechercharimyces sp. CAU 1602 TaxID=2973933 RepID=UPI002161DF0D|nr:stage V sporulation protein AC [Mechercharimyces sp. CAU 1602]MCS1350151.1 stage V sporulation protein AC [Mechercharimyces sp. CAU 1602]